MPGQSSPRYGWDTCVYIAWLLQEQAHAESLPPIAAIMQSAKENKAKIYTSVLTFAEISELHLSQEQIRDMNESFKWGQHEYYDVDIRIAKRAQKIRDDLRARAIPKIIRTPDAIHIATAIVLGVSEFHTLDDDLISLNCAPEVDCMRIRRPFVEQADLF